MSVFLVLVHECIAVKLTLAFSDAGNVGDGGALGGRMCLYYLAKNIAHFFMCL